MITDDFPILTKNNNQILTDEMIDELWDESALNREDTNYELVDDDTREPSENQIRQLMKNNPEHSYYSARESLRESTYSEKYNKPPGQSWGDFWKTY